ncbi:MAG TPA: C1 family peptidase [Nitrososphaeraceae archaeon]|jgi:C1A family cysteine protease
MVSISVEEIKREIANRNAKWEARDHPHLRLAEEDVKYTLGVRVDEEHLRSALAETQINIEDIIADAVKSAEAVSAPPPHVDWREQNKVTPVKDQRHCGSCVSFGTTGALESAVLIEQNKVTDLSEAELFYCGGAGDASCATGWWPPRAFPYLHNKGLSQENCFLYQDHDIPCHTCNDRDKQAIKIKKDVQIMNVTQRKRYLSKVGPLIAVFRVYEDFFSYSRGVYSHVAGTFQGGHCVLVVGYDDGDGAWICKNSWNTGWGDNGYFKMAYGDRDCGMDTKFPMWGIYGTK